jgi:hypothetical protein
MHVCLGARFKPPPKEANTLPAAGNGVAVRPRGTSEIVVSVPLRFQCVEEPLRIRVAFLVENKQFQHTELVDTNTRLKGAIRNEPQAGWGKRLPVRHPYDTAPTAGYVAIQLREPSPIAVLADIEGLGAALATGTKHPGHTLPKPRPELSYTMVPRKPAGSPSRTTLKV